MPIGAFKLNAISKGAAAAPARTAATVSGSRTNSYDSIGRFGNGLDSSGGFTITVNQTPTTIGSGNAGTVEFWIYRPTSSASDTNLGGIATLGSINVSWYTSEIYIEGSGYQDYGFSNFSRNTWYHIAIQTSGNGTWQTYINGARKFNSSIGTDFSSITCLPGGASDKRYRIDEIRISKIARYSGTSITVPTSAFTNDADTLALFHCNTTSEVDDRS